MRIYTRAAGHWDEASRSYVLDEAACAFYEYAGPLAGCKESDQEKQNRIALENAQTQAANAVYAQIPWQQNMAKQQMDLYNQQLQAQMGYQNKALTMEQQQNQAQLDMMNKVFGQYQTTANTVNTAMTPYLSGTMGFSPGEMTTLNTLGMGNIASGYADANTALKAQLLAHGEGGDNAPLSGGAVDNMALLQAQKANAVAGMRNTNQLANYRQALQNQFQAAGIMSGQAGQEAGLTSSMTGAANTSAGNFGSLASRYATPPVAQMPGMPAMVAPPKPPGFWSSLGQSLVPGVLGAAGTAMTGGLEQAFPSMMSVFGG